MESAMNQNVTYFVQCDGESCFFLWCRCVWWVASEFVISSGCDGFKCESVL